MRPKHPASGLKPQGPQALPMPAAALGSIYNSPSSSLDFLGIYLLAIGDAPSAMFIGFQAHT
jgi:hypothetical protein